MKTNPLKKLGELGQSIWLDYIKRDLMTRGQLKKLITEDDLRGMTSNPALFEQAISKSHDYDNDIKTMANKGMNVLQIYAALTQKDVQTAADEFLPVYNKMAGKDGYVSLEVNPHLAHDTEGTIEEARTLWNALNRRNVFIKVPATKAGLPAISQLISEGININVTLLFGLPRYREVADAYITGIEKRLAQGKSVEHVASVASFFLSRIDTLIDPIIQKSMAEHDEMAKFANAFEGQVAIASAKKAYEMYHEIFSSDRFKKLAKAGAHTQRLLWASTGTKNPAYSDIKYVEALIAPHTVNTLPMETLEAYRDHGDPEVRINIGLDKLSWLFQGLIELGIDIDKITQQLEDEGVDKFNKAYDQLIETLKNAIHHDQSKEL